MVEMVDAVAETVKGALRADGPLVSDIFFNARAKEFAFTIAQPVKVAGDRPYVLLMTRSAQSLTQIIREQKLPPGWGATVMDRHGIVVASTGARKAGEAEILAGLDNSLEPKTIEGDEGRIVASVRPSFYSSWRVAAFVPAAVLEEPLMVSLSLLLVAAAILLALTLLLAILFARRVSRPILALADGAQALGHGEAVMVIDSPIREANVVSRALAAAAIERKQAEDQIRFLMRELSHRAKNQLAVVVAMARRAGGDNEALQEFRSMFSERLLALARSTDLLVEQNWKGVPLADLVRAQLLPFETGESSRIKAGGPRIDVGADAAQNLGLVIHELATNAAKYGALSMPGGVVAIRWWLTDPGPRFHISWTEAGGPPVSPPVETGFGSILIQRTVAQALNADVSHEFHPTGVVWKMELALASLLPEKS
jgi:two-component sensor histidine kinase